LHALIQQAVNARHPVRCVGAGHSFSPIVETTGTLLSLDGMRGVTEVDVAARQFEAHAATRISELGDVLWAHGLALQNQGDIDEQAIAGAVSTGTHGSGRSLGTFSGTLCGGLLFDGRGERLQVSATQNSDLLAPLQTSLGMLGCLSRLRIQATKAYLLEETIRIMPFAAVLEQWEAFLSNYRHFSFFWMPTEASAALYNLAGASKDDCIVKLYNEPGADQTVQTGARRTDRSYRIYPSKFDPNFHEMEYFMPLEHGKEIVTALDAVPRRGVGSGGGVGGRARGLRRSAARGRG
jgi:FAD/FMN-containing dehydrogenase